MSILGLTIDYGPYGFMDQYNSSHVCNASGYYQLLASLLSHIGMPVMCNFICALVQCISLIFIAKSPVHKHCSGV